MTDSTLHTRVLRASPEQPEAAVIAEAAATIRAGKLVAFPTETVYGLGANALDAAAVNRIFAAKGRPAFDPIIVHLADAAQLPTVAVEIPPLARDLAAAFWPGALTLVLKKHARIPAAISAGLETVGLRVPAHPVALALLRAADLPIGAPSANLFSRPSPTTAAHVLADLEGRVELILDGGETTIGMESTILNLTGDQPVVLRPGGVPLEALRQFIPEITFTPQYAAADVPAAAPGTLLKHYSPRAEVRLYSGDDEAVVRRLKSDAAGLLSQGKAVGILLPSTELRPFLESESPYTVLSLGKSLDEIAGNLFARLRDMDRMGVHVILTRLIDGEGLALAIRDRLIRAAEGRIIAV